MKFEYRTIKTNIILTDSELDRLGEDRWELVSVYRMNFWFYFFKREY
jgi:hypothetical protein